MTTDATYRPLRIAAINAHSPALDGMRVAVEVLGHEFEGFVQSQAFLAALTQQAFDLLLLEWRIPDLDGIDVIRRLRCEMNSTMPAMVVARHATKRDLIKGLRVGVDVFLASPEPNELRARLEALIRRAFPLRAVMRADFGAYRFLLESRVLQLHGKPIELAFREYDLARFMFQNAGRLLTRKRICNAVWGVGCDLQSRALDTCMSRIRTRLAIGPANGFVLSASYGQGYRLDAVDEASMTTLPE